MSNNTGCLTIGTCTLHTYIHTQNEIRSWISLALRRSAIILYLRHLRCCENLSPIQIRLLSVIIWYESFERFTNPAWKSVIFVCYVGPGYNIMFQHELLAMFTFLPTNHYVCYKTFVTLHIATVTRWLLFLDSSEGQVYALPWSGLRWDKRCSRDTSTWYCSKISSKTIILF